MLLTPRLHDRTTNLIGRRPWYTAVWRQRLQRSPVRPKSAPQGLGGSLLLDDAGLALSQLGGKTGVGPCALAPLLHIGESVIETHVLGPHEIGDHEGRRARDPHNAMH